MLQNYKCCVFFYTITPISVANEKNLSLLQENGAAYEAGGLEVGQLILEVDGHKVDGK
jgi:hypothetical protein